MTEPIARADIDDQTVAPVPDRLDVVSVGLMLCPNRNLTTLTAAVLSLHPHVQVLNHGFERLEAAGLLRFLQSGSEDDLEAFVRGAIGYSAYGRRGDYGGNILLSHAFDRAELRAAYARRYAVEPLKPEIRCLVWKDGARLLEYLRANDIAAVGLAERLPRLRFLSPLRRPVAHLRSLKRYYAPQPPDYVRPSLPDLTVESVAKYMLAAHEEFLAWRQQRPAQFYVFTEDELGEQGAAALADFLGISADETWRQLAATFFIDDRPPQVDEAPEQAVFAALLNGLYPRSDLLHRWYRQATAAQRAQS
jgi:hypothetical protein